MDQSKIMALLNEAAQPTCTEDRRYSIEHELSAALKNGSGFGILFRKIFGDTIDFRPDVLPDLFPFFAIVCGDLNGNGISYVNWDIIPKKEN